MARASTKAAAVTEELDLPPAEPVTTTITYKPGQHDNPRVKWGGLVFEANVPKEITGNPRGTDREQLNHQIIEAARGNKHFLVGDEKKKSFHVAQEPKTAAQYRAYMVDWLNKLTSDVETMHADMLIGRLAQDRQLHELCEVGSDDWSYLRDFFMPKLFEAARADELNEGQVTSLWVQHGFNVLPW